MGDDGADPCRGNLDKLVAKVNAERGIDLGHYRRAYLERRIGNRLRFLELDTYRQYADVLDADPAEYEKLLDSLNINVTGFFRDKVVWDALSKKVAKPLIAAKSQAYGRSVRAWSAGCATGEEPYSLAMMMLDETSRFPEVKISVIGTDVDEGALEQAEKGVYPTEKLEAIPPHYRLRFTETLDAHSFSIAPSVRDHVRFSRKSVFDPPPVKGVDLIVCRNVFIYLDRQQQSVVLDMFWDSLLRGGYLVLGRSEKLSTEATKKYEPVDGKERVYRKPITT